MVPVLADLAAVLAAIFGLSGSPPSSGTLASSKSAGPGSSASSIAEAAPDGIPLDHRAPYLDFWARKRLSAEDRNLDLGRLIAIDSDRVDAGFLVITAPDPLDT